jgi:hypothetical protein
VTFPFCQVGNIVPRWFKGSKLVFLEEKVIVGEVEHFWVWTRGVDEMGVRNGRLANDTVSASG